MHNFLSMCVCCCGDDDHSDFDGCAENHPPANRESAPPSMNGHHRRTYGTKKSSNSAAAAAVFGATAISPPHRQPDVSTSRAPLADITATFCNFKIDDNEHGDRDDSEIGCISGLDPGDSLVNRQRHIEDSAEVETAEFNKEPKESKGLPTSLDSLIEVYQNDRGQPLSLLSWNEIISSTATIVKIAEASFAEVFRITNDGGSSIIKIMRLKLPEQPESVEQWNAANPTDVISELRIMNCLADIPGFVIFKDAHLVQGKPSPPIIAACSQFLEEKKVNPKFQPYFPQPETYPESATFLAIELGDAGVALDEVAMHDIDMVWDVLLGIVIALSRAENEFDFEHRDLHENNICLFFPKTFNPPSRSLLSTLKLGYTGIQVTILDYGLSRATLSNGDKVFFDLENDLGIFQGASNHSQFDTYRRMRTQLFTGSHKLFKKNWHNDESRSRNNGHTWEEFTPYTNVLWIRYILSSLVKNYKKTGSEKGALDLFNSETKELQRRLNPRTWVENGAFESAEQILEFAFQQGWITEEQLSSYGVEQSILSP